MAIRASFAVASVALALLTSCTSTVVPYTADSKLAPESEGENRLWYSAEKFDETLRKSGNLYQNREMEIYLEEIVARLIPEFSGELRVHLLKAPVLNAMALPNGSLYINSGLIAVMENEAQLATVLGHESVHFLRKHSAQGREHMIKAAGWATAAGIVLAGAGIPSDLATLGLMNSVTGHSRTLEQEADDLGYERLAAAGYDLRESPVVFEHMLREVEAEDVEQPYFFSTHPRLQDRVDNFKALNDRQDRPLEGYTGREKFLEVFGQYRIAALNAKLEQGHFNGLIALLSREELVGSYGAAGFHILGDAYRLRNGEGDADLAMEAYARALDADYSNPDLYKSLGMIEYRQGHYERAAAHFSEYMKVAPESDPERGFVKMYLKRIEEDVHE